MAGKREGRTPRRWPVAVCAVLLILAAGYCALCGAAAGRLAPGTVLAGTEVGGLAPEEAARRAEADFAARSAECVLTLQASGETLTLTGQEAGLRLDGAAALERAREAAEAPFLAAGGRYLAGLMGRRTEVLCPVEVGEPAAVDAALDRLIAQVERPGEESAWSLSEDGGATLTRGRDGLRVARDDLRARTLAALEAGEPGPVEARVERVPAREPDFDALAAAVAQPASDAVQDEMTREITREKPGLRLDTEAAKAAFAALGEGESCPAPMERAEPAVTAQGLIDAVSRTSHSLDGVTFPDLLGEAKSAVGGTDARVGNVALSAWACNGTVLWPGERMSYNGATGVRTVAKGYRAAGAYIGGKTKDVIAGGVCQTSSTLYLATLRADLKTVKRANHGFAVGYVPDGMDATVYYPGLDFIFENSTAHPIRVESAVVDGMLTVRIYGVRTRDVYVRMENNRLETYPYSVEYRADASVPRGETEVEQTAYTGRKVECYKCYYSGTGELLKRERIHVDTYHKRNAIVLYNPADGVPSEPPVDALPQEEGMAEPEPPLPFETAGASGQTGPES